MEHSTCTLDISSDEESAAREKDNRGKENVPPPDDISQTRTQLSSSSTTETEMEMSEIKARVRAVRRKELDEGAIEVDRAPLGDLVAEEFYAEGCDEKSVFLVPRDAAEENEVGVEVDEVEERAQAQVEVPLSISFDFSAELKGKGKEVDNHHQFDIDIDTLMSRNTFEAAPKAALLQPIEKAEEGFEVWEESVVV